MRFPIKNNFYFERPKLIAFLVFAFLVINVLLYAQNNSIDSLKNLLHHPLPETQRVTILNSLFKKYLFIDPSIALQYATESFDLSQKINFTQGTALAVVNIGVAYYYQGNYDKATDYFFRGLRINETLKDSNKIASNLNWLGNVYSVQNNFQKAEPYYLEAISLYEKLENKTDISTCLSNLGILYRLQKDYPKALVYYQQSLNIREEQGDKKAIAIILNNIGTVCKEQKNYPQSLSYYLSALKMFEVISYREGIATALLNVGMIFVEQKNYPNALNYLNKSLKLFQETIIKDGERDVYQAIAELYVGIGNYKKAYENYFRYSAIKDTLFNEESSKQIHEMSTKYETEKKEQQIKLLNKDKEIQTKDLQRQKTIRNAVTGGLLLVLFFSFVLINRFLLIKKQKKVIETERETSEKLLLNILPKETADELKLNNSVKPKFYEQVTVMFTDFKGFTTIAEKMSAEELVSDLDFILKNFDEIISKYPKEKKKTIGDSYMCAGGVPVGNSTNPMDVVMAGLEIQEWMGGRAGEGEKGGKGESEKGGRGEKMNLKEEEPENKQRGECESESRLPFSPSPFPLFQVRIGIHTGPVIAGVVGDKKFAYDIWGDAVNTASRMESSGEAGKVNISGETYKFLVGAKNISPLQFTYRGKIPAKNKGEIEMYFVEKSV